MLQIITGTPIYVWLLLAFLIWGGLKARKRRVVSLKSLWIMPICFLIWSIYAVLKTYGAAFLPYFGVGIFLGIYFGKTTVKNQHLKFDKANYTFETAKDSWPLLLSVSLFSLRYFRGVMDVLHPELKEKAICLIPEFVASIITGVFLGRLLGYFLRFQKAPSIKQS